MKPDAHRGWIEAYLVRQRAANADRLPPLEDALKSVSD